MKFNPVTKRLFTDSNDFIKQLHCPVGVSWSEMSIIEGQEDRSCATCNKSIKDISNKSDSQVVRLVKDDPQICIKLDINNDDNIRIVNFDV